MKIVVYKNLKIFLKKKKERNIKVKSLKYPLNDTRMMLCQFSTTKIQKCQKMSCHIMTWA